MHAMHAAARAASLATALLLAPATPAAAQFPDAVATGVRVRIVLPDSVRQAPLQPRDQTVIGTVARVGGDTLHLAIPSTSGTVAVPRSSVRRLSVSLGVPSRPESAARHGLAWAAAGALGFFLARSGDEGSSFASDGEAAAIGAGIGFGIGAILGAVSPSERWRRLRLRD